MGTLKIPREKEQSWNDVEPAFKEKIRRIASAVPFDTMLVYGKRTMDEQQALYNQGRDQYGNVIDKSKIVTKAQPGMSAHNWGLAVDLLPVNPKTGKGDWNYDEGFRKIANEAKANGLTAGYFWKFKDSPHLESPSFSVSKAKEWLKGAGQAISKVATTKEGISGGLVAATGLTALAIYLARKRGGPK